MLTLDLVRATVRKNVIKPQFLKKDEPLWIEQATDLIQLYGLHIGRPYGELKESLKELLGDGPDALVGRGLAKLLEDRAVIEMESPIDPREVRRQIFERAAPHLPLRDDSLEQPTLPDWRGERLSRAEVMQQAAEALKTTPEVLEQALYADLPEAHVVRELDLPTPEWLLERYNVALVQAILLRAVGMEITISGNSPARYRQLFRFIKFFRLMHLIVPLAGGGYRIQLDGPLSLFKLSNRYGLQLAELLPALLLADGWTLKAEVRWGRKDELRELLLSPKEGLISHYPDKGVYETREEQWFKQRFSTIATEWTLHPAESVLALGEQEVVVPDLELRHPDGRVAYLEIVGFWRRGYLERRIQLYRDSGPGNLILAVSRQLQGSVEGLEGFGGEVYVFREVLVPKDIIALAERVARIPAFQPALVESAVKGRKSRPKKQPQGESKAVRTRQGEGEGEGADQLQDG